MLYPFTLKVPAGTPIDKPAERIVEIPKPLWEKVYVYFPPGCAGLVEVAIFYGLEQLWPAPEAEWVAADAITIEDTPMIELPEVPCPLRLKGVSPKATYDHQIKFGIAATDPIEKAKVDPTLVMLRRIYAALVMPVGVPVRKLV